MIITALLYLLSFILGLVNGISNFLAQGWSIWPPALLQGLTYFFVHLMSLDFALNIATGLTVFQKLLGFIVIYFGIKLLMSIFNWIRGSGGIEV